MSYVLFVVRRHVRSRRRGGFLSFISLFSILGVAIGTAALIIALSILGGFEREIKTKVIQFTSHVQVTGFESEPLTTYQSAIAELRDSISSITEITPFVSREAMIKSRESIEGVRVKGIPPDSPWSFLRRYLVGGTLKLASKDKGINPLIVGTRLARKLAVSLGDTVLIFGISDETGAPLTPRILRFRVTGLYETGMSEYDDVDVYTSMQAAQQLFSLNNAATGIDIMLQDVSQAPVVAGRIQTLLGWPYYARTVFQLYRNLFTWIELQKKLVPIVLAIIMIVATVNIIGTLLMIVLEKRPEIGILRAIGSTRGGISQIFLAEGFLLGLIGTILGNVIGYVTCWFELTYHFFSLPSQIYFMSSVPILLRWENFVLVSALALALSVLTSVFPSRIAARIEPVKAIRFG
ncbi:MAG: FtsX-like permease family protein [Bacteroidota bacterium]